MKPKNNIQKRVIEISDKMKKLTEAQKKLTILRSCTHKGYRTKKDTTCMECGHVFNTSEKKCECPHCGHILEIEDTRRHRRNDIFIMCKLEMKEEFQIIRTFQIRQYYKKGEEARYTVFEVVRAFVSDDNKPIIVSRQLLQHSYYTQQLFCYGSNLELRYKGNQHYWYPDYVIKSGKYLPILKRNGFTGKLNGFDPLSLFESLLTDNKCETLFKLKRYPVLGYYIYKSDEIAKYWKQIMIYYNSGLSFKTTDEVGLWRDYLNMLEKLNKDIHNPKYFCVANIKKAHDEVKAILDAIREKERTKDRALQQLKLKNKYKNGIAVLSTKRKALKGVEIKNDNISIVPLLYIRDYKKEGDALNHCVHSSTYWDRINTIVLSARVDNKITETIEFDVFKQKVVQAHGYDNENSEYHDKLINIVERNAKLLLKYQPAI